MTTTKTLPKEVREKIYTIAKYYTLRPKITAQSYKSMTELAHWYEERLEKAVNEAYIKAAMEAL